MRLKGLSEGILASVIEVFDFFGGAKESKWKAEDESMMNGML